MVDGRQMQTIVIKWAVDTSFENWRNTSLWIFLTNFYVLVEQLWHCLFFQMIVLTVNMFIMFICEKSVT